MRTLSRVASNHTTVAWTKFKPASFRRWLVIRPYRPLVMPPLLGVVMTVCTVISVLSSAARRSGIRRWRLCVHRPCRSGSTDSIPHCYHPAKAAVGKYPVLWSRPWFPADRFRGNPGMRRTIDPAPFCFPDHRYQRYYFLRSVSADLKVFALSSPPKCGCDVNSAAQVLQVAKLNKYDG